MTITIDNSILDTCISNLMDEGLTEAEAREIALHELFGEADD